MADPEYDDIDSAVRITLVTEQAVTHEESEFSFHTGNRSTDASREDLLDCAEQLWDDIKGWYRPSKLVRVVHSQWTEVGFTGWHQERARSEDLSTSTADALPDQVAYVVGYRCTAFSGLFALGRRRNRCYLGPLNVDTIGGQGFADGTFVEGVTAAFEDLHTNLLGVANVTMAAGSGLVVTSPTAGVAMSANQLVFGHAMDTMRSRRQKMSESPTYDGITPG